MLKRFIQDARNLTRRRTLAGLAAGLSLVGCMSVVWTDSNAYATLSNTRLENLVGSKGICCSPGPMVDCESKAPFACAASGTVCDIGTFAADSCGGPGCGDSDTSDDQCDKSNFAMESVTATTCTVISTSVIVCGASGQTCMYVTGSGTLDITGCGSATVCSVTSGASCQ
jgi:hypothetical protein